MKRMICLILALILTFGLTACGGSKEPVDQKPVENQSTAAPTQASTEAPTEAATEAPTEAPTESPVADKELSIGTVEGNVYTNRYLGIGCTLDSSWTLKSAQELQQLPADVADLFSGSELGDKLADVQQLTDMLAENVTDMSTMNVLYTKLTMQQRLLYAIMTDEQVVDATLEQKDVMAETYAQAGMTVKSMEKVTVTFLGEDRVALYTVMDAYGMNYYVLQLFDYGLGEFGGTITLGSFGEDKTSDMLDLFYKVD